MKSLFAALGRLALISGTTLGIATAVNLKNYEDYWNGTIKRVQTVDFNLLASTLPSKLSQALIKQDSKEIQRTLDSNYGRFGLVVTNCTQKTWDCSGQEILYMTNSQRSWKEKISLESLKYHPFDLLRDPPPLMTERGYADPHDESWQLTGQTNTGNIIGRVYYVRGVPPSFQEDFQHWLANPLSTSGTYAFYTMTTVAFLLGGTAVWLLIEWLELRKAAVERQNTLKEQRTQQEVNKLHWRLSQQIQQNFALEQERGEAVDRLSTYEQEQEELIRQLTEQIVILERQLSSNQSTHEAQALEKTQTVLLSQIEQREQAIAILQQQVLEQTQAVPSHKVDQLRQQLQEAVDRQSQDKQQYEQSQATIAELKRQIAQQDSDHQQVQQLVKQLYDTIEESKRREAEAQQQREKLEQSIDVLNQQRKQLEKELEDTDTLPDMNALEQRIFDLLGASLKCQTGRWIVLPHFDVGQGRETRLRVDFLLVGQSLVAVIEAKDYGGVIKAAGDVRNTEWFSHKEQGQSILIRCPQRGSNPLLQVDNYADGVMKRLGTEFSRRRVAVYQAIVFAEDADVRQISPEVGRYSRAIVRTELGGYDAVGA